MAVRFRGGASEIDDRGKRTIRYAGHVLGKRERALHPNATANIRTHTSQNVHTSTS